MWVDFWADTHFAFADSDAGSVECGHTLNS